ncbi:hypothetical protein [Subtercola sp. YIM 133946]|uniref:hypothetical protein n=1 Tax=Subtercola sp. YIM 133946 TaxID=3118909 RepID=UPI002F952BF2
MKNVYTEYADPSGIPLDPPQFDSWMPGQTPTEHDNAAKTGGDASGISKDASKTNTFKNADAGKHATRPEDLPSWNARIWDSWDATFKLTKLSTLRDLANYANITYTTLMDKDLNTSIIAINIAFTTPFLGSSADIANGLFQLSNGDLSTCTGNHGLYTCTFYNQPTVQVTGPLPATKLAPDVSDDRAIPVCMGGVMDAGFGTTSRFTLANAGCASGADNQPVHLEFDRTDATSELGIPSTDSGDGSIVYTPTASAGGSYVTARAWAVTADGTYSWPFYVVFRNRNAPTALPVARVDAIRSVEKVIDSESLFIDQDVALHAAESADHVTNRITAPPAHGVAWIDGAGDLHYLPDGLTAGTFTDSITVQATDRFGFSSAESVIPITVSDVVPGCSTGGTETDSRTPVHIDLLCWLDAPTGWYQLPGASLTYSIVSGPPSGSLTDFNADAGVATYTPDPTHDGPVVIGFTATYNGQSRTGQFTINVHEAV